MPASAAASTMPVPFATSTSRPSTVTLTVSTALTRAPPRGGRACAGRRVRERLERGRAEHWAAGLEMLLKLGPELVDVARDRHRGSVAERTEALAEDPVADVEEQVEIPLRRRPGLDRVQDLHHPPRALAARRALAAALVHVELRDAEPELHDAAAVVDDDDRTRAKH